MCLESGKKREREREGKNEGEGEEDDDGGNLVRILMWREVLINNSFPIQYQLLLLLLLFWLNSIIFLLHYYLFIFVRKPFDFIKKNKGFDNNLVEGK